MKTLISHLLGDTRTAILAVLLLRPDEPQHVRELARLTGVSPGTVHRELTALESFAVLRRKAVGRQVYFTANRECPVFEELAGLVRKTAGLVDVMILGELPFTEAVKALAPAQALLRREVNATVIKSAEFLRKRRAKDSFVSGVWKAPRLWVIGSDNELG
jgi:hypothetical protein